MQRDSTLSPISPQLCQRYGALIWSSLDANLYKSALFYAERYIVQDPQNHDARHLYATVLIQAGEPHSAQTLVNLPAKEVRCTGCLYVLAQSYIKLGLLEKAREAFKGCSRDSSYISTRTYFSAMTPRVANLTSAQILCSAARQPRFRMRRPFAAKQEIARSRATCAKVPP